MSDEKEEVSVFLNYEKIKENMAKITEFEQKQKEGWKNIKKLFYSLLDDQDKKIEELEQKLDTMEDKNIKHIQDFENRTHIGGIFVNKVVQDWFEDFTLTPLGRKIEKHEKEFELWKTEDYEEKENVKHISELREYIDEHIKEIHIRSHNQAHKIEDVLRELKEPHVHNTYYNGITTNAEVLWVIGNEIINLMNDKIAHNTARLHEINAKEKITEALKKLSGGSKPEEPCNHDFTLAKVCIHCGEYESLTPRYTVVRKEDLDKAIENIKYDFCQECNWFLHEDNEYYDKYDPDPIVKWCGSCKSTNKGYCGLKELLKRCLSDE